MLAAVLAVILVLVLAGPPGPAVPAAGPGRSGAGPGGSAAGEIPVTELSRGCRGQNAEVVSAEAPPRLVYAAWIGCGGIGFARSTDGGLRFSAPRLVRGSAGPSWDPSVAVAPDGTLYVAFMHHGGHYSYPVVAASADHGSSFARAVPVLPPVSDNFGDRDFIAAGRHGRVYLTCDYGPSAAKVKDVCAPAGSCAFTHGDVNAVIQISADGGRTWGPVIPAGPHFPRNGGISNPVVVQPGGRLGMLSWGHFVGKAPGYKVFPGHERFAFSADGTSWPRHPLTLWPGKGPIAVGVWWIDGNLAVDAGGTLYATWDTQTPAGDIGWLTWSADGGKSWSRPVRVTPDHTSALHLVEAAGGGRGIAYVGWQTSASPHGYATYVRPYSVTRGWLGAAIRVSPRFGNPKIWPGDTFGIATLPGTGKVSITWGSATGTSRYSGIWGTVITLPARARAGA